MAKLMMLHLTCLASRLYLQPSLNSKMTEGPLSDKLARFLFHYRNTPHSTIGMIPAELLMGRKLRSRLDLVKPNLQQYVRDKQEHQRRQHDLHATQRTLGQSSGTLCHKFSFAHSLVKGLPTIHAGSAMRSG